MLGKLEGCHARHQPRNPDPHLTVDTMFWVSGPQCIKIETGRQPINCRLLTDMCWNCLCRHRSYEIGLYLCSRLAPIWAADCFPWDPSAWIRLLKALRRQYTAPARQTIRLDALSNNSMAELNYTRLMKIPKQQFLIDVPLDKLLRTDRLLSIVLLR